MATSDGSSPQLTTVRLQNIAQSYGQSAALMAAVELEVFTAISEGAGTFDAVATQLGIHPVNAERLIVLLSAAGLVELEGGQLRNAADAERFLVKGKPGYMGPWITFTKPQWNEWGRLSEHLRVTDLKDLGSIGDITVDDARRYHTSTFSIGMGAGRRFVRHVDLSSRAKLMDIGGGSGAYCICAANTHKHIQGVVLDLPVVCEVTREFLTDNGVADRISAQPCDFTKDPFPSDCDVAVMASNLPMYGRGVIAAVIAKTYQALLPGGEMHLIGEMTNNERTGPWGPAYWGLGQAISDSKGLAHSEADVLGYFRDAGFERIELVDFISGSLGRVVGHKG